MNPATGSSASYRAQDLVIGGGIAGIVTALGLLDRGRKVVLLDADTQARFGGLALWAFGGMALVGTEEQHKWKVPDRPELVLEDWIRFGPVLCGRIENPGLRLGKTAGVEVHAGRELRGTRGNGERQFRSALPHPLGHRARAG